jgi:hypothetical protein
MTWRRNAQNTTIINSGSVNYFFFFMYPIDMRILFDSPLEYGDILKKIS